MEYPQPILRVFQPALVITKDEVKAIPERVPVRPEERHQKLAQIALEIEATPDELATIDEGLSGEAASEEEVGAAFALFSKALGSNSKQALADPRQRP